MRVPDGAKDLVVLCWLQLVAATACANRGTTGSAPPPALGNSDAAAQGGGGDATVAAGPDGAMVDAGRDAFLPVSDADNAADAGRCAGGGQGADASGIACDGSCATCPIDYLVNPPDPCTNQFFASGCVNGSAASTCGGRCTVANACSPPEDPGKSNLQKTFACPRFLLFGAEMSQAAADDTQAGGLGDPSDPPFNYAVAGHDPDTGGIDPGVTSTCCQCYQLVFETPESASPQPPSFPIPKPLIVQSFNTSAGGAMNFDIFMGAGGFGAFNACVNDPGFGATSKFGSFMYDAFPLDFPTNGGAKFMNLDACKTGGTATAASVQSTACQSAVASLCNQAAASASPAMTSSTRASCIESNRFASLYHQNWKVRAKKVECPANLTRVTGCQLAPAGLPPPNPAAKTVADTDGTWKSGYTTTTMQDCCKPTCAWQDSVSGKGLRPNGPWTSFYSCDVNGAPITSL
jgi:hypothetical protein